MAITKSFLNVFDWFQQQFLFLIDNLMSSSTLLLLKVFTS